MGYEVFTSGNRPEDPGHKFSNQYVKADYTNVYELSEIVKKFSIKHIIPSCHDTAYIAAAEVAKKFNIDGFDLPEIAEMIHRKDRLALAIQASGLPYIESRIIHNYPSAIEAFKDFNQRVVVKPTDMTGGRGVSFVFELSELSFAIEKARGHSISKSVLIQRFLNGSEHGFTAIIKGGNVVFSFFDDEYRFMNRFRVAGTIFPSSIDSESHLKIINWVNIFSSYYKLVDGLVHLQFIQTAEGPYILEICRRPPGDLYPYFVESSIQYPYIENVIQGFVGANIDDSPSEDHGKTVFRHVVMGDKNGVYKRIQISEKLNYLAIQSHIFKEQGDLVSDFLTETIAIFIFEVPKDLRSKTLADIQSLIKAVIE
jgi:hypothetical protein